jgi:hypothetical protein
LLAGIIRLRLARRDKVDPSYRLQRRDFDLDKRVRSFRNLCPMKTHNLRTPRFVALFAGSNVTTASGVIAISIGGENIDNSCYIGQIYSNAQPQVGTDPGLVTINSSGRLGRANVSSRRYKHDIQPMNTASQAIYSLKPVSFRYHKQYDATQTLAFGLIAEEVAEVAPALVGHSGKGKPESVRYEQIDAMLLNEFLKEHHKVQKLEDALERSTSV